MSRILIVEDEALIALDLEFALQSAGFDVAGMEGQLSGALERLEREAALDAVVLDGNLGGESSEPVADRLRARGTPFVVVSGYDRSQLPWIGDAPLVAKPFDANRLAEVVRGAMRQAHNRSVSGG